MASLTNITVVDADLVKVQPDIADFRFSSEASYADEISATKDRIHRKIQDTRALTDEEMDKVKDSGTGNIKMMIVLETISDIFTQNGIVERAELYMKKAKDISLVFFIDNDADGVEDEGEKDYRQHIRFSR